MGGTGTAPATTDICDTHAEKIASGEVRILDPVFQSYGQRLAFSGPIVTVKTFEDNQLTRELVKSNGEGRVLVIDGGGGKRTALMGGKLVRAACDNGWAGIVINGYIRDVDEINESDIGVRAFGSCPLRPAKNGVGDKHVPVHVAGTWIHEGEWLYADKDGILVSKFELSI